MKQIPGNIILAARKAYTRYGVLASVQLAQWALESAWGTKNSGKNNPFGIKAKTGTNVITHEFVKGARIPEPAIFKDFGSIDEAFDYHAHLLRYAEPYKTTVVYLDDYHMYCSVMGKIYATDPDYSKLLIEIIDENKLTQYDTKIIDNATPVALGVGGVVVGSSAVVAKHATNYADLLIVAAFLIALFAIGICLYLWANRTKPAKPKQYRIEDINMIIASFQANIDAIKALVAEKSGNEADLQAKLDAANAKIAEMEQDETDSNQAISDALQAQPAATDPNAPNGAVTIPGQVSTDANGNALNNQGQIINKDGSVSTTGSTQ